ncbi:MAG: hypothetical protein ACYDHA_11575 [Bellilinea sp.]
MREFKSNQDVFTYVEELISIARDHGDEETAQSLQDAIHDNFTTSEILGELAIALEELQLEMSKEYLEPHRADISNAIHGIRKAFRKANRPW